MITQHRPGVVLLDVRIPGRDGLDLAQAIRADAALAARESSCSQPMHSCRGSVRPHQWAVTGSSPEPIRIQQLTQILRVALKRYQLAMSTA